MTTMTAFIIGMFVGGYAGSEIARYRLRHAKRKKR